MRLRAPAVKPRIKIAQSNLATRPRGKLCRRARWTVLSYSVRIALPHGLTFAHRQQANRSRSVAALDASAFPRARLHNGLFFEGVVRISGSGGVARARIKIMGKARRATHRSCVTVSGRAKLGGYREAMFLRGSVKKMGPNLLGL